MRARFLFALMSLPATAMLAVPAQAQSASCRFNLDGEWLGQGTGNRVMIEMRVGGFVSWVPGALKPGQEEANNLFRDVGRGAWDVTFPNGQKGTARLESGLLRIRYPDGWTDTFKRVRPAGAPGCIGGANSAPSQATGLPQSGSTIKGNLALAAPGRVVKRVGLEDLKAIALAEGATVSAAEDRGATILITGRFSNGPEFKIMGHSCQSTGTPGCSALTYILSYQVPPEFNVNQINEASKASSSAVFWRSEINFVGVTNYIPLFDGLPMGYLRKRLDMMQAIDSTVKPIITP